MDFAPYDVRHYPTLSVEHGYREWAPTYESVVEDIMDIALLDRLRAVPWPEVGRAVDLACGTGRSGSWLRAQGVVHVEGIDLTAAMLEQAREKGVYDRLHQGDMRATGLQSAGFDLALEVLACEHVDSVQPLYTEAARLVRAGRWFVIVGYHPHFLLNGIPTHFNGADGRPLAIESHVHLFSDHVKAALAAGFELIEMEEGLIDQAWLERKPKWQKHAGRPVSYAMVWRRSEGA